AVREGGNLDAAERKTEPTRFRCERLCGLLGKFPESVATTNHKHQRRGIVRGHELSKSIEQQLRSVETKMASRLFGERSSVNEDPEHVCALQEREPVAGILLHQLIRPLARQVGQQEIVRVSGMVAAAHPKM